MFIKSRKVVALLLSVFAITSVNVGIGAISVSAVEAQSYTSTYSDTWTPEIMRIGDSKMILLGERYSFWVDGKVQQITNCRPTQEEYDMYKRKFPNSKITTEMYVPRKITYYNSKQFNVVLKDDTIKINAIAATSSKTPGNIKVQYVSNNNHTITETIKVFVQPTTHTYRWAQLSKVKFDTMYIGDKGCIILGDSSGNGKGATTKIVSVTSSNQKVISTKNTKRTNYKHVFDAVGVGTAKVTITYATGKTHVLNVTVKNPSIGTDRLKDVTWFNIIRN